MKNKKKPIIKLKDVCRVFEVGDSKVHALNNLNINVYEGEFVSIMGPSGSGKSTAVNMVGCLDLPSCGEILLDGKNIAHLEESDLAQIRGKKIGFIFQKFNLVHTLTALENVALPMLFQGIDLEKRQKKAKELLKLVELEHRMNHKPGELSGGQQQRVAIARALANDPQVILADEPTGNLDSKTGIKVLEFLDKLHKKGKTIIMVTHNPELAEYADRVLYLKDGAIITDKKTKDRMKNKKEIIRRMKNENK
jgi:putative ABC transport system ATP-binding protein